MDFESIRSQTFVSFCVGGAENGVVKPLSEALPQRGELYEKSGQKVDEGAAAGPKDNDGRWPLADADVCAGVFPPHFMGCERVGKKIGIAVIILAVLLGLGLLALGGTVVHNSLAESEPAVAAAPGEDAAESAKAVVRPGRSLFGYRAFIVLSDSMSRTDFDAGDLVLVREVDCSTLQVGDVIAYVSQNSSNYGETVTHKIRRLTTDANGQPGFVTYGTTTDTDDETIVTYPYVLGKYQFHIPKAGIFFQFLKTTPGYFVCILVPFLLLIIMEGVRCIRLLRNDEE